MLETLVDPSPKGCSIGPPALGIEAGCPPPAVSGVAVVYSTLAFRLVCNSSFTLGPIVDVRYIERI